MIKDMTKGSPLRIILIFALPLFFGNLFQQVYHVVDSIIIAGSESLFSVAAVGSSSPIISLVIYMMTGFSVGVSVVLAQLFGAHEFGDIKRSAAVLLVVFVAAGLVITILGLIFCEPLLALLHTPAEVHNEAAAYLRVAFCGFIFIALFNFIAGALRGLGDSRTPLVVLAGASVLNVLLDMLFVRVFGWGVAGVAVATVVSQGIAALVCMVHIWRNMPMLHISRMDFKLSRGELSSMLAVIIPSGMQQAVHSFGAIMIQGLVNSYGSVIIAGFLCATRLDAFVMLPMASISLALATFAAQNKGAEKPTRVFAGARASLMAILVVSLIIFIVLPFAAEPLMGLVAANHSDIIPIGTEQLAVLAYSYVFLGIMNVYLNALRGAGDVRAAMVIALIGGFLTREPLAYLLAGIPEIGYSAIWFSQPIAWLIGAALAVRRFYKAKWKGMDTLHTRGFESAIDEREAL